MIEKRSFSNFFNTLQKVKAFMNGMQMTAIDIQAFEDTCQIYQLDDDDIVAKYGTIVKQKLDARLIFTTHYNNTAFLDDGYFYEPSK